MYNQADASNVSAIDAFKTLIKTSLPMFCPLSDNYFRVIAIRLVRRGMVAEWLRFLVFNNLNK